MIITKKATTKKGKGIRDKRSDSYPSSIVKVGSLRRLFILIRLVRKLEFDFTIDYGTDEIHSQEMPFSSIAIPFAEDFECFDSCVDVFNDNTLPRQRAIEQFSLPRQWMIFAPFIRNPAVLMQPQ